MFQKPAFGTNSSGFGSFNAGSSTATPFGGFKTNTATSAFGAPPAFGASTSTQPAAGGGLFGAAQPSTSLFGNTSAPAPAAPFGTPSSGFGFGGASTSGGLFAQPNTSGGLFANNQQNTSAFGAKPAGGFGFGAASTAGPTTGGLFGANQNTGTSLFSQQNTSIGGGLFSNTGGTFGQQAATGTAHTKYNPLVGTDVVVKGGNSQNVIIKHHCITCMKEYESKSLEELRLEDYTAGRKGAAAGGGVFSGFQAQPQENKPLFGGSNYTASRKGAAAGGGVFSGFQAQPQENKPLFGGSTFGQPATTSAPSVFGGGGLNTSTGFGQTNTFSFGNNAQNTTNTTGGLFGAAKPAFGAPATSGTGLFGAASTQASTFGTNTSTFGGFGANTQNQSTGLFGAKPATSGFGTPATSGFGGFGAASTAPTLFGAKTQQSAATAFGTATPAFGSLSGGFGTTTSTAGGLFGANNTFGKPATQQAPAFGFGNTQQPTLGTGLGAGLGNAFGQKPAAAPAFGNLGGSMFQGASGFRTGLDSGLGGGLFNNTSLGGNTMGMGMNANTSGGLGSGTSNNVHEQILTLAARPYGDSPLFKNLLPDRTTTAEDVLKPTNPAAMKAALENSGGYRISSPGAGIKLSVRPVSHNDKKSLFDGLEEADASLEDKLCLKPSRKRLVLRQNQRNDQNDSIEPITNNNRSTTDDPPSQADQGKSPDPNREEMERVRRQVNFNDNNNLEVSSDRHGSWLTSPKVHSNSWTENNKSADVEETPRLYPNLDKELPALTSERRASWLTTKPLRKTLSSHESTENSLRELGVRDRHTDRREDKENVDTLSVSEEEHVPTIAMPPHPTGIKLTRPGYYTIPSLDELTSYLRPDGSCVVPNFTVGRKNYGNVYYDCELDVAGLDLDALVHFLNKEVIVYPEDLDKPPIGSGLNRRAIVTLDRVWPRDKTEKRPVTEPERLLKMDYEGKLRRVCDKHDTKFIEYRPQTGSWVFRVEHFSKYGLTDSDEEDDITPDVLKRQLVDNQQLQKAAAPPKPQSPAGLAGLTGLGGLGGLGGLSSLVPQASALGTLQSISSMTSLPEHMFDHTIINGSSKGFDMDTTEDNAESQSLYADSRALSVKSPTSELARLEHRHSHNVQLMKASLYADTEMEDDVSVSTGDQQVPWSRSPPRAHTSQTVSESDVTRTVTHTADELLPMKALEVQPHTIVLQYHRKVPPFKETIAGRLDAACLSDMSVCRARHSRVGFGPSGRIVFATSLDSIADLPKSAELCDLGNYLLGRREDDWSEPVVAQMAIGQEDGSGFLKEALPKYMETLLTFSDLVPSCTARLTVKTEPRARRQLLRGCMRRGDSTQGLRFGVSGEYFEEVWKLCDALWGADLENDGETPKDVQSIVNQHKKLISWLSDAVTKVTDDELTRPSAHDQVDESDCHSERVWTLLVGGRVLEACKLARKHGDLNMATLLAQSAGDPLFRSLVSRQLTLWRECGAEPLISATRLATLRLIAGLSTPRDKLHELDWLRAFHVTARYICAQVPTLEQVVRTYERFFTGGDENDDEDLTMIDIDEMGMQPPVPPYCDQYELDNSNGKPRRILDLRYELIKARSRNSRPTLRPASYTPDPLDYSLCFLLGTWFGNPTIESIEGVASQLESFGLWHLAVQALAYHPDDNARGHLIRGVLSRHAPAKADTEDLENRLQLIRKLQVPEKWLLLAQAHRAGYMHEWLTQAEHFAAAEEWNSAHEVLLDKLLPDAVLGDNLKSVAPLLEKMNLAAQRHEVAGWENGGLALHHYMLVCDEIRGVVSVPGAEGAVSQRLEALRPLVAGACKALQHLPQRTIRHAAARTEMGARLLQLALAGGEKAPRLTALLRALKLPPDCTQHANKQITNELAEQASELCIDSVSSSPISSHHRAAAFS